jgi:hypothetical protein
MTGIDTGLYFTGEKLRSARVPCEEALSRHEELIECRLNACVMNLTSISLSRVDMRMARSPKWKEYSCGREYGLH